MTKIEYNTEKMFLYADGHAGAAEPGQNIVCAGISALTQTLLNMLNDEEEKGRMTVWWNMEPGRLKIRVESVKSWKYGMYAKCYFRMAVTGLKDIAARHPENIEIEEVQDDGII